MGGENCDTERSISQMEEGRLVDVLRAQIQARSASKTQRLAEAAGLFAPISTVHAELARGTIAILALLNAWLVEWRQIYPMGAGCDASKTRPQNTEGRRNLWSMQIYHHCVRLICLKITASRTLGWENGRRRMS